MGRKGPSRGRAAAGGHGVGQRAMGAAGRPSEWAQTASSAASSARACQETRGLAAVVPYAADPRGAPAGRGSGQRPLHTSHPRCRDPSPCDSSRRQRLAPALLPNPLPAARNAQVAARLGCGALAGTTGQTVAYPFDVARRRLQVRRPSAPCSSPCSGPCSASPSHWAPP
jgi:hypothetical protein